MDSPKSVVICASFDDFASHQMRFLHEASRLGPVHVWLWPDEAVRHLTGKDPEYLWPSAGTFSTRSGMSTSLGSARIAHLRRLAQRGLVRGALWAIDEADIAAEHRCAW